MANSKRLKWTDKMISRLKELFYDHSYTEIGKILSKEFKVKVSANAARKAYERYEYPILDKSNKENAPKILIYDVETTPMISYTWGMWDQNIGLNQVIEESTLLSWSAKWYGEDEVMYDDVRGQKDLRDDKKVLKSLWKLLDEADITVAHNGNSFDHKVVNARFIVNGMKPPSSYKKMDTKVMAKRHFRFMSNKLQYLTDTLCSKYKKMSHGKFPGFSMWSECLKGNKEAFDEMKAYNEMDVLSLEELFDKLLPWESASIFNMYHGEHDKCTCGSTDFKKAGFHITNSSKFQKYKCKNCGAEYRDRENLISKEERKKLRMPTKR